MKRREFLMLLSAAAAPPLTARAQQAGRLRRIGWLSANTGVEGDPTLGRLKAFKRALADLGWTEGRNIAFEERWANNEPERLQSLAGQLAALRPDLIYVATSGSLAAVRRAAGTIPIVFSSIADPVGQGFVSSLAQPGGTITGFGAAEFGAATKDLELLKKIAPGVMRVAFMYDPAQPGASGAFAEVEAAAAILGVEASKTPVRDAGEIERAIDALAQAPNVGLFLFPSPAVAVHQELVISLAIRHRLPAIQQFR